MSKSRRTSELKLTREWDKLARKYLPVRPEKSIWAYSRKVSRADPNQGWKLHLSATIETACILFRKIAPILHQKNVLFKATTSLAELGRLNSGLFYGYSQIGKFITVYPRSTKAALQLAGLLHDLTKSYDNPTIPFDCRYRDNSCVYYRYGAFNSLRIKGDNQQDVPAIRNEKGQLVPDRREPGSAVPPWLTDPFLPQQVAVSANRSSPLRRRIKAYQPLAQRGKGGVYNALDLGVVSVRLCILKEGRRHGETSWDGRDGRWRVRREAQVLRLLHQGGVPVPDVYTEFQVRGNYYVAMERIEGKSLQTLLGKKRAKTSITESIAYCEQLAELMAKIHSTGWVWRDCKPQNIILTTDNNLRPLDFEGACPAGRPDKLPWGTAGYLPPEWQDANVPRKGIPQDLYALGATMAQLLSGRAMQPGQPLPSFKSRSRKIPEHITQIVTRLMDVDPHARPDATEVLQVFRSGS